MRTRRNRAIAMLRRMASTTVGDWLLLFEALSVLTLSSLAIALLPFRRVLRLLAFKSFDADAPKPADAAELRRALWAVEATARRLPWRALCFQKGLALYWIMRRRGIDARLHYGVSNQAEKGLRAHVWISHQGTIVLGGDVADEFACLAIYPEPLRGDPLQSGAS